MKRHRLLLLGLASLVSAAAAAMLYAWLPGESLDRAARRAGVSVERMRREPGKVWVRVWKKDARLELMYGDTVVKSYPVSTGPGIPAGAAPPGKVGSKEMVWRALRYYPGDKVSAGDLRTPEGRYELSYNFRRSRVNYRFALINYPDDAHRSRSANPGGDVGIHGIHPRRGRFGRFHAWVRHTRGCIALTNREVDELGRVIGEGTRVEIRP